jgi:hypothetical protein
MTKRRVALVVVVLALVSLVAVAIATRTGASERGSLARLSNQGRPVSLERGPIVRDEGVSAASLLSVRGGRALYRLVMEHGTCIGSGYAAHLGAIGASECPDGPFPTAERPVLDLSVYESTSHARREVSLYRAEGIAADGVAAIAFLRPDGSVALRVPVAANVYESAAPRPNGPIARVVAYDAAGKEVWRSR